MFDEFQYVRADAHLGLLLDHYGRLGAADHEVWQDRLMHLEGVPPRELARLHGELLALGLIEQNTGATPPARPGVVAGCYRLTASGLRVLRRVHQERWVNEEDAEAA